MKPEEVQRLSAIFTLMTDREARSFLWIIRRYRRTLLQDFAESLGIDPVPTSTIRLINALQAHFSELRKPKPDKPAEEEPGFECIGCGDQISEATGLRWDKLNKGGHVTVSVDHSGKPAALDWLTDDQIMEHWFKPWTIKNPNVKFKLLKTGRGDSHITFEPVDGPGNTLKFVWQPNSGTEMSVSEPSGNMVCDSSERSYPRELVKLGGKHEVGHVLGIGHLNSRSDVMYFQASARNKPLSKNDLREVDMRHPIERNNSTKPA